MAAWSLPVAEADPFCSVGIRVVSIRNGGTDLSAMKAILIDEPGHENRMKLAETESPELEPGSIRIRNFASGVNRADLLQRQGLYPPSSRIGTNLAYPKSTRQKMT
jgi:hypothetical protein